MTWWEAALLGLVEGVTEYLPVSSTGHLILTSALLGLDQGAAAAAVRDLEVVIQGGAILAVVVLYRARVIEMLRGVTGASPEGRRLVINLGIAFLPAAITGLLLHHAIEEHLFRAGPVLAALLLGGVAMILIEPWSRRRDGWPSVTLVTLTWRQALAVGLAQTLALWPGTSRAMVTMLAGVGVGLSFVEAAELSFLLGLVTLTAASGFALTKNLRHAAESGTPNLFDALGWGPTLIGMAVAAVAAALAVRWLVGFLGRHGVAPFGWYRVALAVALGASAWAGWVEIGVR